jgi:tetratricopeptide (TPR) repeat protein
VRAHATPKEDPFEAELLFRQGEEHLAAGDAAGASALLEQAVARRPGHAEYHALLGLSRLQVGGPDAKVHAAADIARALAMEPELPAGHEYAGRLALADDDTASALDHLERALEADPHRASALAGYEELCARLGHFRQLERQYRKLIHRVGERDPALAVQLWWRLGDCYRDRLSDRESARVAYEVAAKLAPEEPRLQEALAGVTGEDPTRWHETARALASRWHLAPDDPSPLIRLYELHRNAGRRDAALLCAQALTVRNAASPEARALCQHPGKTPPPLATLTRVQFALLAHPEDDPDVGALFAVMAPTAAAVRAFSLLDIGVAASDRIAAPTPLFQATLESVCALVGTPLPPLYRRGDLGSQAHVAATDPPSLVAGPEALAQSDPIALRAVVGRAAAYLPPGRVIADSLPSRTLKKLLLAAMSLAVPGLRVDDDDGSIASARDALARTPTEVQQRVRELVEQVTRGKALVNLSRWARALARTADRLALLCAGDLIAAANVARQTGGADAEIELVHFALSDNYAELRAGLTGSPLARPQLH